MIKIINFIIEYVNFQIMVVLISMRIYETCIKKHNNKKMINKSIPIFLYSKINIILNALCYMLVQRSLKHMIYLKNKSNKYNKFTKSLMKNKNF